ncbi:hypothetical protein JCM5296_000622 [Sporobolomyces johnsonii]
MRSLNLLSAASSLLLVASPSLAFSPTDDATSLMSQTTSNASSAAYHFDERSGILTEYGPSSALTVRDTFTAEFGLMLERDLAFEPSANKFQKRRIGDVVEKRARDSGREAVEIELTKRGEMVLPESVERRSKKRSQKKKTTSKAKSSTKQKRATTKKKSTRKQKKSTSSSSSSASNAIKNSLVKLAVSIPKISAIITWYTGHDLLNPYCADKSGWTPTDKSYVAAVTQQWGSGRPKCGSFLQLKSPTNGKSIIVRTVDLCGGCQPGVPHVDLSMAAFEALYSLNVGKVADIQVSTLVGPPFDSWTSAITSLYGPQEL